MDIQYRVQADLAQRLPFADGSFDTTVRFDLLEHVADDGLYQNPAAVIDLQPSGPAPSCG